MGYIDVFGIGTASDVSNSLLYLTEAEHAKAAEYMFYAIPFVSWFKLGGKVLKPLIKKSPKLASKMAKITKSLSKNLGTIEKLPETVFKSKKQKAQFIEKSKQIINEFNQEESV